MDQNSLDPPRQPGILCECQSFVCQVWRSMHTPLTTIAHFIIARRSSSAKQSEQGIPGAGDHGGGGGRHVVAAHRQQDQKMIRKEAQEVMAAVGIATGTT